MAREPHIRAHALLVVVEPAEGAWHTYCPVLLDYGAAIWGATREEALDHIRAVVGMVVARMAAEGVPIPTIPADQEPVAGERIVVTVRVPTRDAPAPA